MPLTLNADGVRDPKPKVSVVTPTYNRADLLPETIRSVLAQTFRDFEYLIIDDGSTDDTEAIVRAFGSDKISYHRHEPNQGEAVATNRGWRMARGTYVAVLSSDDPVESNWLETAVSYLDQHPDVIVGYPDWRVIDAESRTVVEIRTLEFSFRNMVAWWHTVPGPGALIRKAAVPDMTDLRDPSYRYAPDLHSWLRLGLRGPFSRIPGQLASWREHATSITVSERSPRYARELIRLVDEFFARDDIPRDIREIERFARSRAHWIAYWLLRAKYPLLAALYLRRSYRLSAVEPPGLPPGMERHRRPTVRDLMRELGLAARRKLRRDPPIARGTV